MVEWMILHSFHHGASRLEYRTIDGEFRLAQIIRGEAFEYPQPPESVRGPSIDHLRTIFGAGDGIHDSERQLRVGDSFAKASCRITEDGENATITIVERFPAAADLLAVLQRFFRVKAGKQGTMPLFKYLAESTFWQLQDRANQAVNRSRR